MYYIYILRWPKKHYVGCTQDIERRLPEHKRGQTTTTKLLSAKELIWYFEKENKTDAYKLERMIKRDGHIQKRINHETFIKAK